MGQDIFGGEYTPRTTYTGADGTERPLPPLYKIVGPAGEPVNGGNGGNWPLPQGDQPGAWRAVTGDVVAPCRNGLHVTDPDHFDRWIGDYSIRSGRVVYRVEVAGEVVPAEEKWAVRAARLLPRRRPMPTEDDLLAIERSYVDAVNAARGARRAAAPDGLVALAAGVFRPSDFPEPLRARVAAARAALDVEREAVARAGIARSDARRASFDGTTFGA